MRIAGVDENIIHQYIGKDVYDDKGRLLLGKGIILTKSLIDKLMACDVYTIYIDDHFSENIEINSLIADEKMISSVNKVKQILLNTKNVKSGVPAMIREVDVQAVEEIIKDLIEQLENTKETLYSVVNLMGADMYTYQHSVHVAILSIMTCRSLNYTYELTKYVAMGALLHDIGKTAVKDNLIQKREALSDAELQEVYNHVIYGYDMVKDDLSLTGYTKQIVRLHHEKRDGSGYPLGLKETAIPDFVKIVTICDMFDAMTSNRVYRKSMPIYKVIDILMADAVYQLDPTILQFFLKNICVYPPGTGVVLCDGRYGLVVKYNKYSPTRPSVRVFVDLQGQPSHHEIDLEENRIIFIEDTVSTETIRLKYNLD